MDEKGGKLAHLPPDIIHFLHFIYQKKRMKIELFGQKCITTPPSQVSGYAIGTKYKVKTFTLILLSDVDIQLIIRNILLTKLKFFKDAKTK